MGRAAAYEFYKQNKGWIESPEEAEKILYGDDDTARIKRKRNKKKKHRHACPECGVFLKTRRGVISHLIDKHRMTPKKAKSVLE